jgi:DNA-binding MarR family transcriptional regulator
MTAARAIPQNTQSRSIQALYFWRSALLNSMQALSADLSSRQMAVLLTVYLETGPHSVKSLSENLGISKPAICRGLDVLEQMGLIKRQRDKEDKRNVLIQRTVKGSVFLSEFSDIIIKTSKMAA